VHHQLGNWSLDFFTESPPWGKVLELEVLKGYLKYRRHVDISKISIQSRLLEHYVRGDALPYDLNKEFGQIPDTWQNWIVKCTGARPGTYLITGENAQLAGLDDLSDSLGHFMVVVTEKGNSSCTKLYEIKKEGKLQYQFAWTRGKRHGFRFPITDDDATWIHTHAMPTRMYNYGHLKAADQFKLVKEHVPHTGRLVWVAYVPWYVMVRIGKPFNVYARFER
jgi:hypothetical protein